MFVGLSLGRFDPASEAEVERYFLDVVMPRALARPGCLGFRCLHKLDEPGVVVAVAEWTDRAASDGYFASAEHDAMMAGFPAPQQLVWRDAYELVE